jgi:hypothetical protein
MEFLLHYPDGGYTVYTVYGKSAMAEAEGQRRCKDDDST